MKKYLFSVIILGLFCLRDSNAQVSPKEKGLQSITIDAIKGQLEFLSSDWMEGRATGERGAYLAADYHQPSDEVSLVNWNKMLDIIKLGYLQLWEAANGEIK